MEEKEWPVTLHLIAESLNRKLGRTPTKDEIRKVYDNFWDETQKPEWKDLIEQYYKRFFEIQTKYDKDMEFYGDVIHEEFKVTPDPEHFWPIVMKDYTPDEIDDLLYTNDRKKHLKKWAESIKSYFRNKKQKTEVVNPMLLLSDVLKPGISVQIVKDNFYKSNDHSKKHLAMYLKHLFDKGYYTHKLKTSEIGAIALNDFNIKLSDNRYGAPKINSRDYNHQKWSRIPLASELLK
jgi:hypothetical protein